MPSNNAISYEDLLRFYDVAGVDCPLDNTPHNRFVDSKPVAQEQQPAFSVQTPLQHAHKTHKTARVPNDAQANNAQQLAQQATTLDQLQASLQAFEGCSLKKTAKNTCFSDGVAGSAVMFIGEAPGRNEDLQGLPFVGQAGQLLNKMLAAIHLKRTDVYIANMVAWRPPGNRTPTPVELEICRPFIERQIELAKPKLLVTLGGAASQALMGSKQNILKLRGQWGVYQTPNGTEIPIIATLHPAYLLRMPGQKKFSWRDLVSIKIKLRELGETLQQSTAVE